MSYRVRFTTQTGATGYWEGTFATRTGATMSAKARADMTGYTYHIEEWPDDTDSAQGPTEAIGGAGGSAHAGPRHQAGAGSGVATRLFVGLDTMPPRVRQEQRIRALAEAIVRRMGHDAPMVASTFNLAHIRDWAAEIVDLCERHGGQEAKPNDAEAIRRLEADNRELRDRLAVAQRQRDEAAAALAKEQRP